MHVKTVYNLETNIPVRRQEQAQKLSKIVAMIQISSEIEKIYTKYIFNNYKLEL